ncbi:MAG: hypothetical protein LCH53_14260 [Bacteroidetes bacterium]|nr:hypothetical protein [Bacteroidota bacterium]
MAKGKPKGYFQFPLCLLTLDLPVKEWVQAVVSYVAIEKGRALRAKIPTYWLTNELLSEADESRLLADLSWEEQRLYNGRLLNGSSMIAEIIASQRLKGVLPDGFDEENPDHQGVALMIRTGAFLKGHMPTLLKQHAAAARHVEAFEKLAGKDAQVRVRKDILWMLDDGKMSEREFRVLVGLYSQIEGRSTPWLVRYDDWAYRVAGYKGREAYEAVHGAAVPEEDEAVTALAEPELAGIASCALCAVPPPKWGHGRRRDPYSGGGPYHAGAARWDLAFWNGCVPDDPSSAARQGFTPALTHHGPRFRWNDAARSKPPTSTVTASEKAHGAAAPFPVGMWIVWQEGAPIVRLSDEKQHFLLIGRVTGFDEGGRVVLAEHEGRAVRVAQASNPAPVCFFLDELAKLPDASDAAGAAPAGPTFRRGPLYTLEQLRTTREKMERLRWWHSFSIGRRAYYSITLNSEQIAAWVGEKAAHKDAVPLRKQDARQAYEAARKNGVERLVPTVAERRKAEEAEAQRAAQAEAQHKAEEAHRLQVEAAALRRQAAQEEATRQEAERRRMLDELSERFRADEEAEQLRVRESAERRQAEADERRRGRGATVPHASQQMPNNSPASSQL